MSYVIRHNSLNNQTYYCGQSMIGPKFGGTIKEAQKFSTREDAISMQTMNYGFSMTTIELFEETEE